MSSLREGSGIVGGSQTAEVSSKSWNIIGRGLNGKLKVNKNVENRREKRRIRRSIKNQRERVKTTTRE